MSDNVAAQYRSRAGIELGHIDQPETVPVEELEVFPTGQAEVVEVDADETDEDE